MKEITLPAAIKSIAPLTDFLEEALEEMGCGVKPRMQISMAVDELFSNIALYAYGDGEGEATVRIEEEDGAAKLTFTDTGIPYNPMTSKDPDTTLDAEKRSVGGLGIFLVKKTMDGMEYAREGGKNVLTIRKKLH